MGSYVYKVSTKPIGTLNGALVYPSQFAYKPYWGFGMQGENPKMSFKTGCEALGAAWRRKADKEDLKRILVTSGGQVFTLWPQGSYIDDSIQPEWVVGWARDVVVTDRRHLKAWIPSWDQFIEGDRAYLAREADRALEAVRHGEYREAAV